MSTYLPWIFDDEPEAAPLTDLSLWRQAQADHAGALADAALALGQLDATLAALPGDQRAGAARRLALLETEEVLWLQGTPLPREEVGRDLMEARKDSDPGALLFARWAVRRLEGESKLSDLRDFLGLQRRAGPASGMRLAGADFDGCAADFAGAVLTARDLHPILRAPYLELCWRLAGVSPDALAAEPFVWTARDTASICAALTFAPRGRHLRRLSVGGGSADDRAARQIAAVAQGARDARLALSRIAAWEVEARDKVASIKGRNPQKVIAALVAHPFLSAPMAEAETGISRMTAERLLSRFQAMGIAREITGAKRFRFWTAAI